MKTLEDVLEEITPTPDPDFVADMQWRLRHGFPRHEPAPERRRALPARARGATRALPRIAPPAIRPRAWAAVAASAMLAVLVTVSVIGAGDEETPSPGAGGAFLDETEQAPPAAARAERGAPAGRAREDTVTTALRDAPRAVPPLPPDDDVAPNAPTRRVERSAQLTLAADPDDFDALADAIFRAADRRSGFVLRSSFTQGESGPGGFFELRVPSANLVETLNELSRLATVHARSESGNDVTAAFVSLRDRLRTARAERKSLLRRLELAVTQTAVEALRTRLAIVGRRITSLRGQLRSARERTQYATVVVELVDEDAGSAGSATEDAVDDAVGSLEDILNFAIRALGILVPVAIMGFAVWLAASYARRRARERPLA
jgi:hypothetical protein